MKIDHFINIPLSRDTLDVYVVRTSILRAIESSLPLLNGKLLDMGCGKMPYKRFILENSHVNEYVGLDIDTAIIYDVDIRPDVTWDGVTMPFEANSFDCAIATEVLEHCFEPNVILTEVARVLKPGGVFFFTTPFFWTLHEVPRDEYRFTPFSLERHLRNSGFNDIRIHAIGGWHASMAQMLGLWVRRGPMGSLKRKYLSAILKPIIRYLMRIDFPPKVFDKGQMLTTIYGTAVKPGLELPAKTSTH